MNSLQVLLGRFDLQMQDMMRDASIALVLKVLGALLTYVVSVTAARLLGADAAGIYFLSVSVVTIASVVGRVGLDNALLRFTATYASFGEWDQVRGVVRAGLRMALLPLLAAAAAVFFGATILAELLIDDPRLTLPLQIMAAAVIPLGLYQLLAQVLRGVDRMVHSVLVQSVWLPALTIVGLLALVPLMGVTGASAAYAAAAVATLLIAAAIWRPTSAHSQAAMLDRADLLASMGPLYAVAVMQLLFLWGSNLVVGIFRPSDEVAIFAAANRTAQLLTFVLLAVNTIVGPRFAALHRQGDLASLSTLARGSVSLMALVTMPGLVLMVALPDPIMGIFGDHFKQGSVVLIILAIAQYVNVVTGSVAPLLIMTGRETSLRDTLALSVSVSMVLALLLIPPFGIDGAAVAFGAGLVVQNIAAMVMVKRQLGFWTMPTWPVRQ